MAAVLKVTHQDQVFRVQLQEPNITYEGVQDALQKLLPGDYIVAKYLDEDDDVCTLCPGSFADFLSLSRDVNGKKILKLTISTQAATPAAVSPIEGKPESHNLEELAASHGVQESCLLNNSTEEDGDNQIQVEDTPSPAMLPVALLKAGVGMFKSLAEQAFKGHCKRRHHSCEVHPKKVKFLIWLLHKNALLNETSMAALGVHLLPQLILFTLERSDKIDWKFCHKRLYLVPVLEELKSLVARTPGLEQCESKMACLVSNEGRNASEALMELLTAIDTLPFEAQVDFFKALYKIQEPRFHASLAKADCCMHWLPSWPLEHAGVICDGCGQQPLRGLRFKCKPCVDCDLCAQCFTRKTVVCEGVCSSHEFDLVSIDFKGKGKGKGKGKCFAKGFFKGKGKGKGKFWHKGCCSELWQDLHSDSNGEGITQDAASTASFWAHDECEKTRDDSVAATKKSAAAESNENEGAKMKSGETEPAADARETELKVACVQLQEMGLGDEEFLMEMLRNHGGDMQDVINELVFRDY